MDTVKVLAKELKLKEEHVARAVALLDEGNTIPFIARYRKEVTGSMDDVTLRELSDRLNYLRQMDKRREEIAQLIDAQGKLTPEITLALQNAKALVELEDIYLPYRPKRKTRASVAREKGLEPLAQLISEQRDAYERTFEEEAALYIDEEKSVATAAEALAGACDIIAEDIANTAEYRKMLRELCLSDGEIVSKQAKEGESVYEGYYDFAEPIPKLRSHRVLAINRGEKEEYLKVTLRLDEDKALARLSAFVVKNPASPAVPILSETVTDSYRRLLFPSLEREVRAQL
ncbi:MAG: RNA-binding transcriptional accessory protein, partial [Clostridia bacterium]|nr:RNA-binding transcriptional accessory protein [Clostridia bacterium]